MPNAAKTLIGLLPVLVTSAALAAGFPNVPQTPGTLLSGLNAPQQGRTAILAFHNGLLFTVPEVPSSQPGADFLVRTWDIADPTAPVELETLGITPMPINAHGYFKSGPYLILGPNWPPESPWSFLAGAYGTVERTAFPGLQGAGVRGNLFQPWFVGDTYWSYGEVSGDATIARDGVTLGTWDHLGETGVIGHPFLLGDLLIFASDQSRTGVATYDVSDPTNPVLLDVLTSGGPGGYWPELWSGDGRLYVVFPYRVGGNGFRVVDVTDPTDLQFLTDRPLPGDESMYIQFQDEYAFMGGHKVDMRTFESVLFLDGANAVRPSDGGVGVNTSQFLLPLGNLVVTGGIGPDEGMAIWAHQAEPDTRGPQVSFHVPQDGRTGYPLGAPISLLIHETLETATIVNGTSFIVRPVGGSAVSGRLTYAFDDILTFTPDAPLLADTTYEVVLPAGGIEDAAGNGMVPYSFTFSTGSTVSGNAPPAISSLTASAYPVAPAASVTLSATANDPDGDPVELRFDFGDGSPRTAWSTATATNHAYSEPGHYRATVQARDDSGALASRGLTVTVTTTPTGARPPRSSPIACDDTARRVWVVNPDNDTVTRLHADLLTVDFEVGVCDDPRSLALSQARGEVWVACRDDDTVRVLNAASGALLDTIEAGYGRAPHGVAVSPDGATVYVTLEGSGELVRYDAATRSPTGMTALGPTPRAIALSPDGANAYVTRFLSTVNEGEIWDVDTATLGVVRTLDLPKLGGELNRDGTASGKGVPSQLVGITLAPGGDRAWIAGNKPNSERGLFFAEDLDTDNTVRNLALELDLGSGDVSTAIDLDNSDSASAVGFSPLGDYLLVALQGSDEVVVLDALANDAVTGLGAFVTRAATSGAPQGVCVDGVTGRTFVKAFMGRAVTVLETDALFRFGDKSFASTDVPTVAAEALPATELAGKRIFYRAADPRMSAEGYLSCATCHLDGGHDGRVWDFTGRGEGFRNTTSLRGRAGMAQGNVHWTANFDEIQDFENDMRLAFGGSGFLSDADFAATMDPLGPAKQGLSADLDALAAYVASLGHTDLPKSPYREPDGTLTAEAMTGQGLFQSLGCDACHAGAELTDSTLGGATLHDVGTLRTSSGGRLGGPLTGIDTPTLLGLWNTPPYLHDGSAATLDAVFTIAGGEILQAETGSPSGGANIVDQYVNLNNDDTVHGRAYVALDNTGATLSLAAVDGGSGGVGALELRYSTSNAASLELRVNGTPHPLPLAPANNDPGWRHTHWRTVRLEGVTFTAGAGNTVEIEATGSFPNISLDDILISTSDDLALATPHRQVTTSLSPPDRDALLAYLRQLDGRPAAGVLVFADGFESGGTTAWTLTVP